MIVFPAIDLAKGKCVRLLQGRRDDETVYGEEPAAMAKKWQDDGAAYLHLVDLDGAFDGASSNLSAVRDILATIHIPVQLGGGIRTLKKMETLLQAGVSRVILGSVAVERPEIVKEAVHEFGAERIVAGIDARDGKVAIHGWKTQAAVSASSVGKEMKDAGVRIFVFTDISRDGMLTGPNVQALQAFAETVEGGVIASGGISSLDDIKTVAEFEEKGVVGIITGKALYEKKFTLPEAIKTAGGHA